MGKRTVFAASIRDLGLGPALRGFLAAPFTTSSVRRLKRRKLDELSRDGFDAAHGTDTAGVLVGRELGPRVTRGGHLVAPYETTSEAAVRAALDGLDIDFARFVFVDLGCGKGKPLMIAASYPFRRLVGVDISPTCVCVARRNITRYRPETIDPSRVELVVADVEDFELPGEPLVVYLYNPFPAPVLTRVVAKLEASIRQRPRDVVIVYVNPRALGVVGRSRLFERVPTIADRMPMAAEGTRPYEQAAVFVTRASRTGATPPA